MTRLFFLSLLLISITAYSQSTTKASKKTRKFIDEASNIIRKNSLYKDSLNWEELRTELNALPLSEEDSTSKALIMRFFTSKLRQAGDKHSFFLPTKRAAEIRNTPASRWPEGAYLGEGIGLLKIPHCMNLNEAKDIDFANTIRAEIKSMDSAYNIQGWIVDLRHNGGGNMWPMLAGLNALIDDGTAGYFVLPAFKREVPWPSVNGELHFSKARVGDYKIKNTKAKIAVLIDSMTGSSGEMAAISLIGLPNVKVFGQPSAGYTTANQTFQLSDGTQLYLATSYVSDRTKKPYLDKIIPDVIIKNNSNTGADETVEASKKWLLQSGQ